MLRNNLGVVDSVLQMLSAVLLNALSGNIMMSGSLLLACGF